MSEFVEYKDLESSVLDVLTSLKINSNAHDDDMDHTWNEVIIALHKFNELLAQYMSEVPGGKYGYWQKLKLGDELHFSNGVIIKYPKDMKGSWLHCNIEMPEGLKVDLVKGERNASN